MSTMKQVILQDEDQGSEKKLGWSYIEWAENEVVTTGVGVVNAETQTDWGPFEDKGCQTSNPVIMHIDLKRTHSKLKQLSLADTDKPFFQFDRQAPGRISTSPTLRRMRSTRRSVIDPNRMGSTREEPSPTNCVQSPVPKLRTPLAPSPLSDGEINHNHQAVSSSGRQKTRWHRSKTLDNSVTSSRRDCRSAHPTLGNNFGFADGEVQVQVSIYQDYVYI